MVCIGQIPDESKMQKKLLSLFLPEREKGVKMTYGPVWGAPMSITAFRIFKTDYF